MPQKLIGNFINILTRKYFCFTGRAGRAEFWLWILVMFIVSTVLGFVPKIGSILSLIWTLAVWGLLRDACMTGINPDGQF